MRTGGREEGGGETRGGEGSGGRGGGSRDRGLDPRQGSGHVAGARGAVGHSP